MPELTLIGAGAEQTIIGQDEPWDVDQGDHKGIYIDTYLGASVATIKNLQVTNVREGIATWNCDATIDSCTFAACDIAVYALHRDVNGSTLIVSNSLFDELARDMTFVATQRVAVVMFSDCSFHLGDSNWSRQHVSINYCPDALIENCSFIGGESGVSFDQRSHGRLVDCTFEGQEFAGYSTWTAHSSAEMTGCTFAGQKWEVDINSPTFVYRATNCVFSEPSLCSHRIAGVDSLHVNACDLDKGPQYAVVAVNDGPPDPRILDFTDNYWGTDEPDSIAAWIQDANDVDSDYTVLFEPFRTVSTPVETRRLGDIKKLFR